MPDRFRVALQGFSDAERKTLAQCFELPPGRIPSYVQVAELWESDFIVADTNLAGVVTLVMQAARLSDSVFVGTHPVPGALAHATRPIDPRMIVRELDALSALRGPRKIPGKAPADDDAPASAPGDLPEGVVAADADAPVHPRAPAPTEPAFRRAAPPTRPGALDDSAAPPAPPAAVPASAPADAPADPKVTAKARARAASARRRNDAQPSGGLHVTLDALVLDDSEVATQYLAHMLEELGFKVHEASTSAQALELLTHQPIAVALLDIVLGDEDELDGLDICQRIKHEPLALGGGAPLVVLVSGQAQASDRVRGTLAGADAFLTKPFKQQELVRVLESCGLSLMPTLTMPVNERPRA